MLIKPQRRHLPVSKTIAAIATPPGEGGLAVIRISGADAHAIAAKIFRPVNSHRSLQDAKGEVRDVPSDVRASVSEPKLLVTSSLTGTFPEGIRIGEVVDLSLGADGLFKSGTVRLGRALSTLREVTVLIPISEVGNQAQ